MRRYRRSSKKRGIIQVGAALGAMLIFMNVNGEPMSGQHNAAQTDTLDQEVKVAAAIVTNVNKKENSLNSFKYEETVANLDAQIELQNKQILLNGDAAEAFRICKRFYTAKDFEALKLPRVSVQAGASLYLTADVEGSVIHTFTDKESVELLYVCEDGNFYYVEYDDLYRGYVKAAEVDTSILGASQLQQASLVNLSRFAAISEQEVYLWSEPSEAGEMVAVVVSGLPMAITDVQDDWLLVSAADCTGYVNAADVTIEHMLNAEVDAEGYIKPAREALELQKAEEEAAEAAAAAAAAEAEAEEEQPAYTEEESSVEAEAQPEPEVPVEEEEPEESSAGESESYEEPAAPSGSGESSASGLAIMNLALNYQGVPYVWGGHSPSGFDCSGLVYYCAIQNGLSIPRCADTQYFDGAGTTVSFNDLQPGDLVFFSSDWSSDIEHVGIYIGGNQFVHASSGAGYVTISDLSGYYTRNYYGALRLN